MILAIDPGERHCGTAYGHSYCEGVQEYDQPGLFDLVERWIEKGALDLIVLEEYRLYPWKLQEQGFSEVRTVEAIGVIKYLAERGGVPVIMQPALIKKPTAARMKAAGVKLLSRGRGPHCRDAELHLYYYWHHMIE